MKISIPNPCREEWQNMLPTEKGAFCLNCKKEVIDFTQMSKEDIIFYLSKNNNVCAKLNKQKNVDLRTNSKQKFNSKYGFGFAALFALSTPLITIAQEQPKHITDLKQIKENSLENDINIEYVVISGVVKENDLPLPAASIVIKGTKYGTETDFDGKFEIIIEKNLLKKIKLEVSYVGMKTKIISIKNNTDVNVNLEVDLEYMTIGYVEVIKEYL